MFSRKNEYHSQKFGDADQTIICEELSTFSANYINCFSIFLEKIDFAAR